MLLAQVSRLESALLASQAVILSLSRRLSGRCVWRPTARPTRRGQLCWDPNGGGVLPGEARTAKGGQVGIMHDESPSLASEDFRWYVCTRARSCAWVGAIPRESGLGVLERRAQTGWRGVTTRKT